MSRAFTKERDDAPEPPLVSPRRREAGRALATVVVDGIGPVRRSFTIVDGADSDVNAGRLANDSPLAQALLGAQAGQDVVWRRPSGNCTVHVVSVAER